MGTLKLKRIYDPPEDGDGLRILVDRLWPRGVSRERAALDRWDKAVAPSKELRQWFGHQPDRFTAFADAYRLELAASPEAAAFARFCAAQPDGQAITLLYAARDPRCNHAVVLQAWLGEAMKAAAR